MKKLFLSMVTITLLVIMFFGFGAVYKVLRADYTHHTGIFEYHGVHNV